MKDNIIPLKLVSILSDGKFHSEEQLSRCLNISLEIINKYIYTLKEWGLNIFTIPKEGCRLIEPVNLLDEKFIRSQIKTGKVTILSIIDSTNQYLLDHLNELHSGDICIAEFQKIGRGRRGRRWFAPFGTNVCLSIYWHFKKGFSGIIGLSLAVGIIIAEILQKFGVRQVRVKWPNDLYLQDRKLAGILIELAGKIRNAVQLVIGIGINLTMCNIKSQTISQGWISLQEIKGITINRNILIIKLIQELRVSLELIEREGQRPFLSRWKQLDNFINRPVKLTVGSKDIYGISLGIDMQGALLLKQNGIIRSWIDGEISLCGTK